MRYFYFIECDINDRMMYFNLNFYSKALEGLPTPFFTLEDLKTHPGFVELKITKTNLKKLENAKVGAVVRILRSCSWSSESGGPQWYAIKAIDSEDELYKLYYERERIHKEAKTLQEQLQEQLKKNDLHRQLKLKEAELLKMDKRFKELKGEL